MLLCTEGVKKEGSNYQEIKTLNSLAHVELLISCDSDLYFGIIENSKRERFPGGDTALAWLNFVEKFEPRTKMNVIKLKEEVMKCGLESFTKDPNEWLINLESINWKLKGWVIR